MTAFAGWEFLWGLGMPFAMFFTFAPAYLDALNAPRALIGFVLAFPSIFSAAQLLTGYLVPPKRRLSVYRAAVVGSLLPWLLYAIAAAVWGDAWQNATHIALYVFTQVLFVGAVYGGQSLYYEMLTDNIPPRRRGRLFGYRAMAAGAAGLLAGYGAWRVLEHWPKPLNFRVCFIIGVSVYLLSCGMIWLVRDQVNPAHATEPREARGDFWRYLREMLRRIWADPNYRIFLFFMAVLSVAAAGAPFMVAAARERVGASAQGQGAFALVYLGSIAACGWVIGLLADRFGYRLIGVVCGLLLALAYGLCLVTTRPAGWYAAYGAFSVSTYSLAMLLCNMSAELFPHIAPRRLMALGNVLIMLVVLPASTLSGAIVDRAGSYDPIFIANACLSLVAAFGFALIVREPREGALLMVKEAPKG